jgi:hypothetical protein
MSDDANVTAEPTPQDQQAAATAGAQGSPAATPAPASSGVQAGSFPAGSNTTPTETSGSAFTPTQTMPGNQAPNVGGMTLPPDVPGNHAKLVGMLAGLGVAISAAGKSIGTHGREGGAPDVVNYYAQQAAQQREKQDQSQKVAEFGMRQKALTAQQNLAEFQLQKAKDLLPLEHQEMLDRLNESTINLLTKLGVSPINSVAMIPGQSTQDHASSVLTSMKSTTTAVAIPTQDGAHGEGKGQTAVYSIDSLNKPTTDDFVTAQMPMIKQAIDMSEANGADPKVIAAARARADLLSKGTSMPVGDFLKIQAQIVTPVTQSASVKQAQIKTETEAGKAAAEMRPKNTDDALARNQDAIVAARNNPTPANKQAATDAASTLQAFRQQDISKTYADSAERIKATRDADDADLKVVAAELVKPDNLTSLKDVASMRGDQRLRLYSMAKQLDPKFQSGVVDNKIRFLNNFTNPNGKTMGSIASNNTFLEHAGDLQDLVSKQATNLPLLNAPLNKIRSKVGDASYTEMRTALEPVITEYTNALKAGYAPTLIDVQSGKEILPENASPNQMLTAVKQMGHTVMRRMDSTNQEYRAVMGGDYPDLITPNGKEAANKLGLGAMANKYRSGGEVGGAVPAKPTGMGVNLADARNLPANKGKTDAQIKADIESHGHTVLP